MIERLLGCCSPRRWFLALVGVEGLLLVIDLLLYFLSPWPADAFVRRLMDITLEVNLPTLYASLQAVLVGLAGCAVARTTRLRGWWAVGGFFIFLGLDDLFRLHEGFGTLVGKIARGGDSDFFVLEWVRAFPSYYWHVVAAPFFVIAGVVIFLYLWRTFSRRRFLALLFTGLGCYAVAMGMDYFDGVSAHYRPLLDATGLVFADARHLMRAAEEFLEMLGTSLILFSFLQQWRLEWESPRRQ